MSGNFLFALRSFESNVTKFIEGFSLPHALVNLDAPGIIGILTNDSQLYFAIDFVNQQKNVIGGVDINNGNQNRRLSFKECESHETNILLGQPEVRPTSSSHVRSDINLTQIAKGL